MFCFRMMKQSKEQSKDVKQAVKATPCKINPISFLQLKDEVDTLDKPCISPTRPEEVIKEITRPRYANLHLMEDRALNVRNVFNKRIAETSFGSINDTLKINIGPLTALTLHSFTLERLLKNFSKTIPQPDDGINGKHYLLLKFEDSTFVPQIYLEPVSGVDDEATVAKKNFWTTKSTTRRRWDDAGIHSLVLANLVARAWHGLAKINVVTDGDDHCPWITSFERFEIRNSKVGKQVNVSPTLTLDQVMQIAKVPVSERPLVISAVAFVMNIKQAFDNLPAALTNLVIDKEKHDNSCFNLTLSRAASLVVTVPDFFMVGVNTSIFASKSSSDLDTQRSCMNWFWNDMVTRPFVYTPTQDVQDFMVNIDHTIYMFSCQTFLEEFFCKFSDGFLVYLRWVDKEEFAVDRSMFTCRTLSKQCAERVQKMLQGYSDEFLERYRYFSLPRTLFAYNVSTSTLSGASQIPVPQLEGTIMFNLMACLIDKVNSIQSSVNQFASLMGQVINTQNNILGIVQGRATEVEGSGIISESEPQIDVQTNSNTTMDAFIPTDIEGIFPNDDNTTEQTMSAKKTRSKK